MRGSFSARPTQREHVEDHLPGRRRLRGRDILHRRVGVLRGDLKVVDPSDELRLLRYPDDARLRACIRLRHRHLSKPTVSRNSVDDERRMRIEPNRRMTFQYADPYRHFFKPFNGPIGNPGGVGKSCKFRDAGARSPYVREIRGPVRERIAMATPHHADAVHDMQRLCRS